MVTLKFVSTDKNPADLLTKALGRVDLATKSRMCGLANGSESVSDT